MNYYVVIPAHNEEAFLATALQSVLGQTLLPKEVVVVNDHSNDATEAIIDDFSKRHSILKKVNTTSSSLHLPGSKVINAFNAGLLLLDEQYDFLVKMDADIILPEGYFEKIASIFKSHPRVGIAGGFIHEQDASGNWKLNHPMDRNHIRGAFKSYSKACFNAIGGLKNAMGWDTLDELLAQYHGFDLYTDPSLIVQHLRPIGGAYNEKARLLQGRAMYRMGYGFWLTAIASLKMATKKRNPNVFIDNLRGFFQAQREKAPYLVDKEEAAFIRRLRWRNIKQKLV